MRVSLRLGGAGEGREAMGREDKVLTGGEVMEWTMGDGGNRSRS